MYLSLEIISLYIFVCRMHNSVPYNLYLNEIIYTFPTHIEHYIEISFHNIQYLKLRHCRDCILDTITVQIST